MRPLTIFITCLFVIISVSSCRKDTKPSENCFSNDQTVRQIVNKLATIKSSGTAGKFYIVESGTIDTRLNPCNLAIEFQVNNLQVEISGEVKATVQGGPGLCCIENFVITKISK